MLEGIDVSAWQATTPPMAGLAFAFVRSSYGTSVDPRYGQHAAGVADAGLVLGAYHYFVPGYPAADQVATFLGAARGARLLAIDLEGTGDTAAGRAVVADMIARIQATGRRAGLYHSLSGYPSLGQDWRWVADWSASPTIPFDFWQYRGSPLDLDRYNGDAASFAVFLSSEGAPMPVLSGNAVPGYIDIPAGETLYDVDGLTVLGRTVAQPNTFSPGAPKGSPVLRLFWRSYQSGIWQLVAAAPNGQVRPTLTPADLEAARTAGLASARAEATAIVNAAAASIQAIS